MVNLSQNQCRKCTEIRPRGLMVSISLPVLLVHILTYKQAKALVFGLGYSQTSSGAPYCFPPKIVRSNRIVVEKGIRFCPYRGT